MQPIMIEQVPAGLAVMCSSGQASDCDLFDGAAALHVMGRAALACAARHAGCPVVMVKADSIEFSRPIPPGSNVEVQARVAFQGLSSMTVIVGIVPQCSTGGCAAPAVSGRFMILAVDAEGRPVPISVSDQHTEEESRP